MPKDVVLKTVWNKKNLVVKKGALNGKSIVKGEALGAGLFFYSGAKEIRQRFAGESRTPLGKAGANLRCLWNSGLHTDIINQSARPAIFYQVQLKSGPSQAQVALAASRLLYGRWPRKFRSSVLADLEAIGELARAAASSKKPSAEQAQRAQRAKEDLEFKLAWFNAITRQRKRFRSAGDQYLLVAPAGTGGGDWGGGGGGGGGFGGGWDPTVNVTVKTLDSDGVTEIKGYWVYARGTGYREDDMENTVRFQKSSSPTRQRLYVGHYFMWMEKSGTRGKPWRIDVGSIDRPSDPDQDVDLTMA